jgi:hypothetical protein
LYLSSADEIFGPITTLRRNNRVVKHVPWSAFKLGDSDWERVVDVRDILNVSEVFCSLFRIKFTHIIGLESDSATLFFRKRTHPLACSSRPRRFAVKMGEETRVTEI